MKVRHPFKYSKHLNKNDKNDKNIDSEMRYLSNFNWKKQWNTALFSENNTARKISLFDL